MPAPDASPALDDVPPTAPATPTAPTDPEAPTGPTASDDPTRPPGPPPFWAYTPPTGPLPAPLPPARPRWRRTRRLCVAVVVVGVLVVAGAAVVGVRAFLAAGTPEAAARAYFDALARGDAAAALGAGPVPAGGRALVSADVLRATLALTPIDAVTTGAVTRNGDGATVAVRYRLGGSSPQEVDDAVDLRRVDGRWQLVRSAVPVSLTVTDAASWAAVPAGTPFAVPDDTQLVFPGAVPVEYRTPLLEVSLPSRVVRLAGSGDALRVSAAVSAAGRETITRSLVAALTACAAGGADVDAYCPQPPAGRADGAVLRAVPQSFAGTLPDLDRLDLDLQVETDSGGTIGVSGSVDAKGTWQVLDYDNVARERSGSTSITFGGTVAVGATDDVVWERT